MKLERFIARRYLISKHKINFITIISFLSIAGITLGVAALIVVLSVFNGFGNLVTSFLRSFDPDIRIESINPDNKYDPKFFAQHLSEIKNIKSWAPYVEGKVVAVRGRETQVINLKGITEESGRTIYELKKNVIFGRYDLGEKNGTDNIILGLRLADRLECLIGDTVTIISPAGIEDVIAQTSLPLMKSFVVSGIFSSNNNEYDESFMFTNLHSAQHIFKLSNRIQGIDIRLDNINNSSKVKEKILTFVSCDDYNTKTWYDFHSELYTVMQIERWSAYIILSLIIAVATFNILGSLSMSVIEKKRDIGILNSMGADKKSIIKIFMYEGLLIGLIGTAAGSILGYLICYLQIKYKIYPLDPTQYKIDALPLQVQLSDFFFIAGMSLLLSFFASLLPARRAAKVNPLEAIKWE